MDYERHYEQYRAAVEDYLSALFAGSAPYDRLYDAMRYSVLSGGKRIRPVLTLEFARLGGIDWHLAPGDVVLSPKDSCHPRLEEAAELFDYNTDYYA